MEIEQVKELAIKHNFNKLTPKQKMNFFIEINKDGDAYNQNWSDEEKDQFYQGNLKQIEKLVPKSMSWGEVAKTAVKNLPKDTVSVGADLLHALIHPLKTTSDLADIAGGAVLQGVEKATGGAFDLKNKKYLKEPMEKAKQVGKMLVEQYGSIDGLKNYIANHPAQALTDILPITEGLGVIKSVKKLEKLGKAGKVASTTLETLLNPLKPTEKVIEKTGELAGKLVKKTKESLATKEKVLTKALEGKENEVLEALKKENEYIEGSKPTAAEAVADLPNTPIGFQRLGAEMEKVNPTEVEAIRENQKQARLSAIGEIAKDDNELKKAKDLRALKTNPMYEGIRNKLLPNTYVSTVEDLQEAINKNKGNSLLTRELRRANNNLLSVMLKDGVLRQEVRGDQLVSVIDGIKSQIKAQKDPFIRGKLEEVKTQIEKNTPGYTEAQETFKELSEPINQQQVGQYVKEQMSKGISEDVGELSSSSFANTLKDASGTIKKATGMPRFEDLGQILTPQQLVILENIQKDLVRYEKYKRLSKKGKDVADLSNELEGAQKIAPQFTINPQANFIIRVSKAIMNRFAGRISEDLAKHIAEEMLSPERMSKTLQSMQIKKSKRTFDQFIGKEKRKNLLELSLPATKVQEVVDLSEED